MASVHSRNLEIYNAANFVDSVSNSQRSNLYFTFGRTIPWATDIIPLYTAPDIQDWYNAIQSLGALKVPSQVTAQKLNAPIFLSGLNDGSLTADDVKLSMITDSFTQSVVYPVVRQFLGCFGRYPDSGGFAYYVEQLGLKNRILLSGFTTAQFVESLYNKLFSRPSDKAGFEWWTTRLDNGTYTRLQVLTYFLKSVEYNTLNRTPSDFVNALYLNLLSRQAEPAGYAYWIGQLNIGIARADIVDYFLASTEFNESVHYDFILTGVTPSLNNPDFLSHVYNKLGLNAPAANVFDGMVARLDLGTHTRIQTLNEILNSTEYNTIYSSDYDFIESLYENLLNRHHDKQSYEYWINEILTVPRSQIIDAFLTSDEFMLTEDKNYILGYNFTTTVKTLNYDFVRSDEFANLYGLDASKVATNSQVTAFFKSILNRTPTTAELSKYTNYGYTLDYVINDIIQSAEFRNNTNDSITNYLLSQTALAISSQGSNEAFLTSAYEFLLNREPDAGGFAYWLNRLAAGMSRAAVIDQFLGSDEYKQKHGSAFDKSEGLPPSPDTSVNSFNDYWRNMIGGKKITGNDVSLAIPRFNWVRGVTYTQYDDKLDSSVLLNPDNPFYVVTDEFNVYKCLYNNNGSPSINKPTLTLTTEAFQTSDKYIWKYMYSITSQDQLKFTTSKFIPVRTIKIEDGSSQWEVQRDAIDGAVYVCQLSSGGGAYTSDDIFVQIVGDGSGANAFAVRNISTNTISEIVVDNEGYGYSRANVYVYAGNGSGCLARAILSPPGGHGSDAVSELGGSYVVISSQLNGTEAGEFLVSNEYRQVGILQDPIQYGTSNVFGNLIFSQASTVVVSGQAVNYQENEYVYQGNSIRYSTFKGTVLNWDPFTNQIKLIGVDGDPTNDRLIGYSSAAAGTLISVSVEPNLKRNTGKLLYIDNIPPIQRDASQTEDFKIVIKF